MNGQHFPEEVIVTYKGKALVMKRHTPHPLRIREGEPYGYYFECPCCSFTMLLYNNHKISVVDGKITMTPSIGCPHWMNRKNCKGGHYWLKDGVLTSC